MLCCHCDCWCFSDMTMLCCHCDCWCFSDMTMLCCHCDCWWFSDMTPKFRIQSSVFLDNIQDVVCCCLTYIKRNAFITVYYEFSLLRIFSLVIQPWMSAYIRKTDGVYMYVFGLPIWAPKNNNNGVDKNRNIYASLNQYHNTE